MTIKITQHTAVPVRQKKAYQTPKVNVLGNVRKLTLKSGSSTDGFGTFA
jgi:hypothetical protein